MSINPSPKIIDPANAFLQPANAAHRQYEALRAYFVDNIPCGEAARRFGYTPGTLSVMCCKFRKNPHRDFFLPAAKKPVSSSPSQKLRDKVVALRKQNLSIYDISKALAASPQRLSPAAVALILKAEGFARLPRRGDAERPSTTRPQAGECADVRKLDLSARSFRTKFGGLFLFLPYLCTIPLAKMLQRAGFPGSQLVPPAPAVLALLGMKLFGSARHSHVMSYVLDEGLALFAGLNVMPKRSFLTEYSCRIKPECYPRLMKEWFEAMKELGLERALSLDLDFHTIPFHGEDALMEKHYVSKRSRRQKGVLAFVAQESATRVFCYANGDLRKEQQADEVLRFVQFWKDRTGRYPEEVVFDSKLTTYANLNDLTGMGIKFITLRRRSERMLRTLEAIPASAWRQVELSNLGRAYRTPKVLDQRVEIAGYEGTLRQIAIRELGHEKPTILLTNQERRSAAKLIDRYAQRMLIENGIADGIEFFHMDALSSVGPMKVNCDLQLTLMASSLYRLLACEIGKGYERAKSSHLFRHFVDAVAKVTVSESEITVAFQRRAHNPLLLAAGFDAKDNRIPWLGNRRLLLTFG